MRLTTAMTAATPMTTPISVSTLRSLCAHRLPVAIPTASVRLIVDARAMSREGTLIPHPNIRAGVSGLELHARGWELVLVVRPNPKRMSGVGRPLGSWMRGLLDLLDHLMHTRRHRTIGVQPEIFLVFAKGILRIILSKQDVPQEDVRGGKVRHVGNGFAGMRSSFLPTAQGPVGLGEFVVATGGVGLELESAEKSRFCLGVVLSLIEDCTQGQIRFCRLGIEAGGLL